MVYIKNIEYYYLEMSAQLKIFQIGLTLGWLALSYYSVLLLLTSPLYEVTKANVIVTNPMCTTRLSWDYYDCYNNPMCTTRLSWDYYDCYFDAQYNYNQIDYNTKVHNRFDKYPKEGTLFEIEFRNEEPNYIISPNRPFDKYKIPYITIITAIITSAVNIVVGLVLILDYIERSYKNDVKALKKVN